MRYDDYYGFKPYVRVADRRRQAEKELAKRQKKGLSASPVVINGRTIAKTFWGKAWCDNLEGFSDYANRLPRGRTYVRNGSVVDLQIAAGSVTAMVSGSDLYEIRVKIKSVPLPHWKAICTDCAGGIDSLVELLQGRFSKGVMERICQRQTGLFPSPKDIELNCSCPDWATMCKHVAAVLYGIGARLDAQPELLFRLREVDEKDLIAHAGAGIPLSRKAPKADKVLESDDLSALFGLELAGQTPSTAKRSAPQPRSKATAPVPAKSRKSQPPARIKKTQPRKTRKPSGKAAASRA